MGPFDDGQSSVDPWIGTDNSNEAGFCSTMSGYIENENFHNSLATYWSSSRVKFVNGEPVGDNYFGSFWTFNLSDDREEIFDRHQIWSIKAPCRCIRGE